jgi:hypothetical protein
MNYQLVILVFSKEMGNIPISLAVNIPESLAKALMNVHVVSTKLVITEVISPVSMPLTDFKTEGIKLPDRVKDHKIDGKGGGA